MTGPNPEENIAIETTTHREGLGDALLVDGVGGGHVSAATQQLVSEAGRPLVVTAASGFRIGPDGRPTDMITDKWVMPFWVAAQLAGTLDQLRGTLPPELQARWAAMQRRVAGERHMAEARAELDGLDVRGPADRPPAAWTVTQEELGQAATPHRSDYGVARRSDQPADRHPCPQCGTVTGPFPETHMCTERSAHVPDSGPSLRQVLDPGWCSDHPELRPDSVAEMNEHMATEHAREMAGARGEDVACERCGTIFDPIAVCAEHGWCSRCHEPEAQPWHRAAT